MNYEVGDIVTTRSFYDMEVLFQLVEIEREWALLQVVWTGAWINSGGFTMGDEYDALLSALLTPINELLVIALITAGKIDIDK